MAQVLSFRENPEAYGLTPIRPNYARDNYKRPALPASGKQVLSGGYDSTLIKPLETIPGLKLDPNSLKGIVKPKYIEADFEQCCIDYNWQRELDQSNLTLIEFGVKHFNWTHFKIPNGIQGTSGKIYITDGQTSALICYHHPEVLKLPIMVTRVNEQEFVARCANAFVSLNECRRPVSAADRFTAMQVMGDPESTAIAEVFRKYHIKPLRKDKSKGQFAAGETRMLKTFQGIYRLRGQEFFERLCSVLNGAKLFPIQRIHTSALTEILLPDMEKNKIDDDRLISAIRSIVNKHAINEAILSAKRRMWTSSRALAEIYKERYRMRAQAL